MSTPVTRRTTLWGTCSGPPVLPRNPDRTNDYRTLSCVGALRDGFLAFRSHASFGVLLLGVRRLEPHTNVTPPIDYDWVPTLLRSGVGSAPVQFRGHDHICDIYGGSMPQLC